MRGKLYQGPYGRISLLLEKALDPGYAASVVRVFISYQHEDVKECKIIADYLMNAGIDVYFDEYDKSLSEIAEEGDSDKITKRIQDGIEYSSHMLCVVSPSTVKSYWVPFEVGYGYGRTELAILTLKGIKETDLPDYMKTVSVVRGTKSFNVLIAYLLGESLTGLESKAAILSHSKMNHPLDGVLDWQL